MVTAVVRVGTLMNRVPAKQYAMVLVSYFARNGWAPEEVEQAADGIETSADLLHMITLDGGLTPRPFVTWRESQNGKPDRRLYSRSEAIEDLDKHGSGVTLSDLYESVPGEDGKIRFRKK